MAFVHFRLKHYNEAVQFYNIAHKKGAITLLNKLISKSDDIVKGARFELDYALQFSDEIIEIGRALPGNSEIDFITKGNVFVNAKAFDWSKPFYQMDFGIQRTIDEFLGQLSLYNQYGASQVKFVFKGSVPDAIREALEAAGAIVELLP